MPGPAHRSRRAGEALLAPRTGTAPSPCRPPSVGRSRGSLGFQPFDIVSDAGFHCAKLTIVTGGAQPGHISLRKTLVAALEVVGEVDELDLAFAQRADHRFGNGAERLGTAGAAVEDAAQATFPQP